MASGAYVLFGVHSPVEASSEVTNLISAGWQSQVGGKLEFEPDWKKILEKSLAHIDAKRAALGLVAWAPDRFGASGDAKMMEYLAVREAAGK